jgi:hypothetical protein
MFLTLTRRTRLPMTYPTFSQLEERRLLLQLQETGPTQISMVLFSSVFSQLQLEEAKLPFQLQGIGPKQKAAASVASSLHSNDQRRALAVFADHSGSNPQ